MLGSHAKHGMSRAFSRSQHLLLLNHRGCEKIIASRLFSSLSKFPDIAAARNAKELKRLVSNVESSLLPSLRVLSLSSWPHQTSLEVSARTLWIGDSCRLGERVPFALSSGQRERDVSTAIIVSSLQVAVSPPLLPLAFTFHSLLFTWKKE